MSQKHSIEVKKHEITLDDSWYGLSEKKTHEYVTIDYDYLLLVYLGEEKTDD